MDSALDLVYVHHIDSASLNLTLGTASRHSNIVILIIRAELNAIDHPLRLCVECRPTWTLASGPDPLSTYSHDGGTRRIASTFLRAVFGGKRADD